jgi:hypothetical protein
VEKLGRSHLPRYREAIKGELQRLYARLC